MMARCCALVTPKQMGGFHSRPCYRSGAVVRDGKHYCKMHDPKEVEAKREVGREAERIYKKRPQ